MRNKVIFVIILSIAIIFGVTGCNNSKEEESKIETGDKIAEESNEKGDDEDLYTEVNLYFSDNDAMYFEIESRKIKDITVKKVIEELIKGPTKESANKTLPEDIEILDVKVEDEICYLNFNNRLKEQMDGNYGASCASMFLVGSITNTLVAYEEFNISKVAFLIEGQSNPQLGQFGDVEYFEWEQQLIKPE